MGKRTSKAQLLGTIILGAVLGVSVWHLADPYLAKTGLMQSAEAYVRHARLQRELRSHLLIRLSLQEQGICPEAIVLLASHAIREDRILATAPAMGFVIGDGSLVLTAAHCLSFPTEEYSHRPMSRQVVVISPFYGDVFDAAIAAMDPNSDLALLRPSWKGHPALRLGNPQDLSQIKEVYAATRSFNGEDFLCPVRRSPGSPLRFDCQARMEAISVLAVDAPGQGHFIHLGSTRYIVSGWSGSPLIDTRTRTAVGVLTQLCIKPLQGKTISRTAKGTNLAAIESFLQRHDLTESAWAGPRDLASVGHAAEAFALVVKHIEESVAQESTAAQDSLQQLLIRRPDSPVAHRLLAYHAHGMAKSGKNEDKDYLAQAEEHLLKAMDLDPNDPQSRVAYGNLLRQSGRYAEALVQTQAALALDPDNDLALVNRVAILAKTDPNQWFAEVRALTEHRPAMAYAWFLYSEALRTKRRFEDALAAARKATDLDPNGLYWGELARAEDAVGDLDHAEANFERMTKACGCQSCWAGYADFLIDHRSMDANALSTAQRAAEKVEQAKAVKLSAASRRNLRVKLNMAEINLAAQSSMQDAERAARGWIDRDPDEGHAWWTLADLVRMQQRFDEAVAAAQKAVDLDPNGVFNFAPRLADCLAKAGRLNEAEQTYQQMLTRHPERAYYWFWYAEYLADQDPDQLKQARQALDRASDPNAQSPVEPNDLAALRRRLGER